MNNDDRDFNLDSYDSLFEKSSPPWIADLQGPLSAPRLVIPDHVVQATVATVVSVPKSPEGVHSTSSQRKRTHPKSTAGKFLQTKNHPSNYSNIILRIHG